MKIRFCKAPPSAKNNLYQEHLQNKFRPDFLLKPSKLSDQKKQTKHVDKKILTCAHLYILIYQTDW